jgi:hypothetical protein
MDNLLQMKILQNDSRGLFIPTYIQKLTINTEQHVSVVQDVDIENEDVGKLVALHL